MPQFKGHPELPLPVNFGHPLARGLLEFGYILDGKTPYSAFRKSTPSVSGTSSPTALAKFNSRAINLNDSPNYVDLGRNFAAPSLVASGFFRARVNSLAVNVGILQTGGVSGQPNWYAGHFIMILTGGDIWFNYADGTGAGSTDRRTAQSATGTIVAGEPFSAGFVTRAVTDWSIYKDGVSLTPTYSGTGGAYSAGSTNGILGKTKAHSGDKAISVWAYWDRALSDSEMRAVNDDPFQLLVRPAARRYYKAPAAGGFIPAFARNANVIIGAGV